MHSRSENARKRQANTWLAGLFLTPHDAVTWQTFDDAGRDRPGLVGHFTATLAECWTDLRRMNDAGAGVFAMINAGDGQGRATRNVQRVRAVYIDCDDDPPMGWHLEPSMIVASGRGLHAYWCVTDCRIDTFREVQERLISYYGSDRSVKDLPRVMRVAGFDHRKSQPRPVVVSWLGPWGMYPTADVVAGLPPSARERRARERERIAARAGDKPSFASDDGFADYDIVGAFRERGAVGRPHSDGKWSVLCPWHGSHTVARDPAMASDTVVWPARGGKWPQFKCFHGSCADRGIVDVLREFGAIGKGVK